MRFAVKDWAANYSIFGLRRLAAALVAQTRFDLSISHITMPKELSPPSKGVPRSGGGCSFFSIDQHHDQRSSNVRQHIFSMHAMSSQDTIKTPPRHRGHRDIIDGAFV